VRKLIVLLTAVAVLAGCGGTSNTQRAQSEWDNHEGTAWQEFTEGYGNGWANGCEWAKDSIPDKEHEAGNTVVFELLPDCSQLASYAPVPQPKHPPKDPRQVAERLGFIPGCNGGLNAYWTRSERRAKYPPNYCRAELKSALKFVLG
jgi:hypothetical protein